MSRDTDDDALRLLSRQGRKRYSQYVRLSRSRGLRPLPPVPWLEAMSQGGIGGLGGGAGDPVYTSLSQVPGYVLDLRADIGFATWQVADFNGPDLTHPQYLSTNGVTPAGWAGVNKFTLAGYLLIDGSTSNGVFSICGLSNLAGTQTMFYVARTSNNTLEVHIASSLSDNGANKGVGSQAIAGNNDLAGGVNWAGQGFLHFAFVFDGTQSGNANRLKLYVNGVRDPSVTFTGTIPALLTSPTTGSFVTGFDLWQGALMQRGGLYNLGVLAGYSAADSEIAALANLGSGSGYPLAYGWSNLPAGSPAQGSFTNFWQLSESSTGAVAVSRADSKGGQTLTDGLGAGGNVASKGAGSWADQSGHNNHGNWPTRLKSGTNNPCVIPTLVPNDINGHAGIHFSDAVNHNCPCRCGQFGLVNNPFGITVITVVNYDFADASHEMVLHGSDINSGTASSQASGNILGLIDNDDFGNPFGHPGTLAAVAGDGTHPNGWSSATGVAPVGSYALITYRSTPGTTVRELWKNGVKLPTTDIAATPPWSPPYFELTNQVGLMAEWSLGSHGNIDNAAQSACFMGKVARHVVILAALDNATLQQVHRLIAQPYNISVP